MKLINEQSVSADEEIESSGAVISRRKYVPPQIVSVEDLEAVAGFCGDGAGVKTEGSCTFAVARS